MRRLIAALLGGCLAAAAAHAREPAVVRGEVVDGEGEPVPFANVQLAGTTDGAATGREGRLPVRHPAPGRAPGGGLLHRPRAGATERAPVAGRHRRGPPGAAPDPHRARRDRGHRQHLVHRREGGRHPLPPGRGHHRRGRGRHLPGPQDLPRRRHGRRRRRPLRARRRRERDPDPARPGDRGPSLPARVAHGGRLRNDPALHDQGDRVFHGRLPGPLRQHPLGGAGHGEPGPAPAGPVHPQPRPGGPLPRGRRAGGPRPARPASRGQPQPHRPALPRQRTGRRLRDLPALPRRQPQPRLPVLPVGAPQALQLRHRRPPRRAGRGALLRRLLPQPQRRQAPQPPVDPCAPGLAHPQQRLPQPLLGAPAAGQPRPGARGPHGQAPRRPGGRPRRSGVAALRRRDGTHGQPLPGHRPPAGGHPRPGGRGLRAGPRLRRPPRRRLHGGRSQAGPRRRRQRRVPRRPPRPGRPPRLRPAPVDALVVGLRHRPAPGLGDLPPVPGAAGVRPRERQPGAWDRSGPSTGSRA